MSCETESILEPGGSFGAFEVVKRLGKGGMGEVYLVAKPFSPERFAVKVLDPAIAERNPGNVERFIREAEFAMKSRHPNLIEVYDVGRDPETNLCYLTMEYLQGGSLKDLIAADGEMSFPGVTTIATDIARALAFIESKGLVHRDVKPDNILFSADGSAKLADLGISCFTGAGAEGDESPDRVIGTPAYMAPEQMLDAASVDSRADVYSLGVVMYEMIAGRRPNEGDDAMRRLAKALEGMPFPDVRTIRPDTPAYLASLVSLMTRPSPSERPENARRVLELIGHPERIAPVAAAPEYAQSEDAADVPRPWYRDRGILYAITATILAVESLLLTVFSAVRRF